MRVWLARHDDGDNAVWVEHDAGMLTLTRSGRVFFYTHAEHNDFVIKLLTKNTDDWELV